MKKELFRAYVTEQCSNHANYQDDGYTWEDVLSNTENFRKILEISYDEASYFLCGEYKPTDSKKSEKRLHDIMLQFFEAGYDLNLWSYEDNGEN